MKQSKSQWRRLLNLLEEPFSRLKDTTSSSILIAQTANSKFIHNSIQIFFQRVANESTTQRLPAGYVVENWIIL